VIREWISLFFSVSFLVLMVAGIFAAGASDRISLHRLTLAMRLYAAATVAETCHLACKLIDVPNGGWLWVALSLFNLACAVAALTFTSKRRELKAKRVQAEAERTVRDYWRGGGQ
jgi:hypothetical protein